MKRTKLAPVAGALLITAAIGFWAITRSAAPDAEHLEASQTAEHTQTASSGQLPANQDRKQAPPASRIPHPFPRIATSRSGLPLDGDPFGPESVEEQRWLDRHGFPNSQQWAAYNSASDALLEQAARAGDKIAVAMWDARKLSRGDQHAGAALMTQGVNGSGYALSSLSAYMASSRNGNPSLAYSLSRVMELRGDWRAAASRDFIFPTPLTTEQRIAAEAEAQRMFNEMRANSTKHPFVDPRPRKP